MSTPARPVDTGNSVTLASRDQQPSLFLPSGAPPRLKAKFAAAVLAGGGDWATAGDGVVCANVSPPAPNAPETMPRRDRSMSSPDCSTVPHVMRRILNDV